ncbi:hypothetical protein SDC9_192028 [bioreactor metagenome]|uniref:Uncharacterized protein n=1 Tax=bioreactor metagenome TaxID=1076179 RepID=A0A645IAK8_9ZZZZ
MQVRFSMIVVIAHALEISLGYQGVDLVGGVRLRYPDKIRKFANGRAIEQIDDLGGERLRCAEASGFFTQLTKEVAVMRQAEIAVEFRHRLGYIRKQHKHHIQFIKDSRSKSMDPEYDKTRAHPLNT